MNRRVMGMALWQVLVLVGLGLGNVGLLCFGGTMLLNQPALPTLVPTVPAMAQVSETPATGDPATTPAAGASATPEPSVTPTLGPTPTPIPGWEKFVGNGMELWLPESFTGGDPALDADVIVQEIRALGPTYADAANDLEQQIITATQKGNLPLLFVFDTNISGTVSLTGSEVYSEPLSTRGVMELNARLDDMVRTMDASRSLVERQTVRLDHYEAGLLIVEYKLPVGESSVFRRLAVYVIPIGDTVWYVQYFGERANFRDFRSAMEQSINTFTVLTP